MQEISNTARSNLVGGITPQSTGFIVKEWEGVLFKNITSTVSGRVVIEKLVNGDVTRREIVEVKVNPNNPDTFVFVENGRAVEACVQNDTANPRTLTQEILAFDNSDIVSQYITESFYTQLTQRFHEKIDKVSILTTEPTLSATDDQVVSAKRTWSILWAGLNTLATGAKNIVWSLNELYNRLVSTEPTPSSTDQEITSAKRMWTMMWWATASLVTGSKTLVGGINENYKKSLKLYQIDSTTDTFVDTPWDDIVDPYDIADSLTFLSPPNTVGDYGIVLNDATSINVYKSTDWINWTFVDSKDISHNVSFRCGRNGSLNYWRNNSWYGYTQWVDLNDYYTKGQTQTLITQNINDNYFSSFWLRIPADVEITLMTNAIARGTFDVNQFLQRKSPSDTNWIRYLWHTVGGYKNITMSAWVMAWCKLLSNVDYFLDTSEVWLWNLAPFKKDSTWATEEWDIFFENGTYYKIVGWETIDINSELHPDFASKTLLVGLSGTWNQLKKITLYVYNSPSISYLGTWDFTDGGNAGSFSLYWSSVKIRCFFWYTNWSNTSKSISDGEKTVQYTYDVWMAKSYRLNINGIYEVIAGFGDGKAEFTDVVITARIEFMSNDVVVDFVEQDYSIANYSWNITGYNRDTKRWNVVFGNIIKRNVIDFEKVRYSFTKKSGTMTFSLPNSNWNKWIISTYNFYVHNTGSATGNIGGLVVWY